MGHHTTLRLCGTGGIGVCESALWEFATSICSDTVRTAWPPHECGGHLWTSTVVSVRPLANRRGIAGHTGNSHSDCHSSTRRVEARGAGSNNRWEGWVTTTGPPPHAGPQPHPGPQPPSWSPAPCWSPAPPRSPKWPDTDPDADTGAAPPVPTATPSAPAAPRVPWDGAGEQEHGQKPDDPYPLRPLADALMLVLHGDLLPYTLDDHSPQSPGSLLLLTTAAMLLAWPVTPQPVATVYRPASMCFSIPSRAMCCRVSAISFSSLKASRACLGDSPSGCWPSESDAVAAHRPVLAWGARRRGVFRAGAGAPRVGVYTSYKVANMLVEFSTSIPRTQLRPGYGDGFLGAPLQRRQALETHRHGSKESSVARRQHQASRTLEVRRTFEPSRVSAACVVQAYERVVPITRRPAPPARTAQQTEGAQQTQHVGGRQPPCLQPK